MPSANKSKQGKLGVVTIGIGMIGIALALGILFSQLAQNINNSSDIDDSQYSLIDVKENCLDKNRHSVFCDQKLVSRKSRWRTVTIESNISKLFREQLSDENDYQYITDYYFSPQANSLIFISFSPPEACCVLYSFDLESRQFSELENGRYWRTERISSPDHRWQLTVGGNGKSLFAIDVTTDNKTLILQLKGNETFYWVREVFAGTLLSEIKWLDNHTIQYDVFDDRDPIDNPDILEQSRPVIDTRTITIPQQL